MCDIGKRSVTARSFNINEKDFFFLRLLGAEERESTYMMLAMTAQPEVMSIKVPSISKSSMMRRSTARYTNTPVTNQIVKIDRRAPRISENTIKSFSGTVTL